MQGCTDNANNKITAELTGAPPKKRRGVATRINNTVVDLSGNARRLGDLAMISMPFNYCMQKPRLFEHDLSPHDLPELGVEHSSPLIEIDLDVDQSELRGFM